MEVNSSNNALNYDDLKIINHNEKFENALFEIYPVTSEADSKSTSYVTKKSDYLHICDVLRGVKIIGDHNKRHHFKKKNYSLMYGLYGKLARNKKYEKTNQNETKLVACLEDYFEIIYDIHCIKRMHQGLSKFLTRSVIDTLELLVKL